jgi:hypothetical protein
MPPSITTSFQWHPHVHEQWAEERLHFWFLKYQSIYNRQKYVEEVEARFDELGIHSYTVYELTGGYDLMVRAWVPYSLRGAELNAVLYGMDNVTQAHNFKVLDIKRHWPWRDRSNGSYEIRTPEGVDMTAGFASRDLITLNAVSKQAILSQTPNSNGATAELDDLKRKDVLALLREYEDASMLVRPKYRSKGIKFVVLIASPPNDPKTLGNVSEEIARWLDAASRRGTLNEASLYFGQGMEESRHLILARVPHHRYHEVSERLLEPINRMAAISTATRTVTYTVPTPKFVAHREVFPVSLAEAPLVPEDGRELLEREESQTFEVKGSGLVNLERWIKGDGEWSEEPKILDGIAQAVVALLNSNGGIVVLGALEEADFPEDSDPHARLGDYLDLQIGQYLCFGVDREMKKRKGWDPYVRHLRRQLLQRIGGGSDFWLPPFEKREVVSLRGETKTLVAIPVPEPDEWFWLNGKDFAIRRGPESPKLKGPEVQIYMRVMGERGGWRSTSGRSN